MMLSACSASEDFNFEYYFKVTPVFFSNWSVFKQKGKTVYSAHAYAAHNF